MTFFRQHEERHLSAEIKSMKWNPKFDLIAIAHRNADVTVYRLVGWQKVWQLNSPSIKADPTPPTARQRPVSQLRFPPCERKNSLASANKRPNQPTNDIQVTSLEWRPDGKVLAIGYSRCVAKFVSSGSQPIANTAPGFGNSTGGFPGMGSGSTARTTSTKEEDPDSVHDAVNSNNGSVSSISLVDVENGQVFRVLEIDVGIVSCMCWQQFEPAPDGPNSEDPFEKDCAEFTESCLPDGLHALPKLVPLVKSYADKNDFNSLLPNFAAQSSVPKPENLDENVDDIMKTAGQKQLSVLAVGTEKGAVQLYALGVFKCGLIILPGNASIVHLAIAPDFEFINIVHECGQLHSGPTTYSVSTHNIENLRIHRQQYFVLASIYCKLISFLKYLHECMQRMYEAWEEILIELDNKLSNYLLNDRNKRMGRANKEVLLADEFLELLVFGSLTDTLEKFLHNFTDKGLKKLGQSIENTYQSMLKLIVAHLQPVTQYIFAYVHTLRAICQWNSEFGAIGLDGDCVQQALRAVGSFHMKTIEMQQVIDHSIRNVRCFFKWLYSMIIRVHSDSFMPPQQDSCRISRRELEFVADFIQENFEYDEPLENVPDASSFLLDLSFHGDDEGQMGRGQSACSPNMDMSGAASSIDRTPNLGGISTRRRHLQQHQKQRKPSPPPPPKPPHRPTASNFTLERVGQYLKDAPLGYTSPTMNDLSFNHWINYVREHRLDAQTSINGQSLVYPHEANTSLLQECKQLEKAVRRLFDSTFSRFCSRLCPEKAQITQMQAQPTIGQEMPRFTHNPDNCLAYVGAEQMLHVIQFNMEKGCLQSSRVSFIDRNSLTDEKIHILDVQFYSDELLTLLLQSSNQPAVMLVQFQVRAAMDECGELPYFCNYSQLMTASRLVTFELDCESTSPTDQDQLMQIRRLDGFRVSLIGVSGSRKVCCISSLSGRRVRIFEMDSCEEEEVEEDEEDDSMPQAEVSAGVPNEMSSSPPKSPAAVPDPAE